MKEPVKVLLVYVNEVDRWNDVPLYAALVQRCHQLGLAGATANIGLMGFGHHQHLHHKGLFGIADDRPVTITIVDAESRIRAAVPEIRQMVGEGLLLLLDAELIADADAARDAS